MNASDAPQELVDESPMRRSLHMLKVGGSNPLRAGHFRLIPHCIWGQYLGEKTAPYLRRWVIDFGRFSIRLHHWLASDDLRAPHDHAWDFTSILLAGSLIDRTPGASGGYSHAEPVTDTPRTRWSLTRYDAAHRHSVVVGPAGAWTLLLCGPEKREWGFWTARKDNGVVRFRHRNKYFREHGHHQ